MCFLLAPGTHQHHGSGAQLEKVPVSCKGTPSCGDSPLTVTGMDLCLALALRGAGTGSGEGSVLDQGLQGGWWQVQGRQGLTLLSKDVAWEHPPPSLSL